MATLGLAASAQVEDTLVELVIAPEFASTPSFLIVQKLFN
jgi:hypothetical protein